MSIQEKVNLIHQQVTDITTISDNEYARCLQIFDKAEHNEEYKRLLFNGVIQHFSKIALIEIGNTYLSLMYADKSSSDDYDGCWFSRHYFLRNAILQMASAWNKTATLIKYRFAVPDGRYGSEMDRVLRSLRKNTDFRSHRVKTLIDSFRSSHEYEAFIYMRDYLSHNIDPGYINYPKGNPTDIDWLKLTDIMWNIVNIIYNDHLTISIDIDDEIIDFYKVKVIIPPHLEDVPVSEFNEGYFDLKYNCRAIINLTLNLFDYVKPWLVINIKNNDLICQCHLLIAMLNDISFRLHDAFRSFSILLIKLSGDYSGIPEKVIELIEKTPYYYLLNVAIVRLYSVFDKVGHLFTRVFSMPKDTTYFKTVSLWIIDNADLSYNQLKYLLSSTIESNGYKALDLVRQQYIHGQDLTFDQYEGTQLTLEYFLVMLFESFQVISRLVEFLHLDFFINEVNLLLPGSSDSLFEMLIIDNPYMPSN
ncbi:MAG: hypothetical protein GX154_06060 [Clostridiales bacterium]|nr:hypothetical protein [Clostridiales bacterium]